MLGFVVLFLIILVLILIAYSCYFSVENEYKVLSINNVKFNEEKGDKYISYNSDYLSIKDNIVYVIYYDLPINVVYWTFGMYNNDKCIEGVNMGQYQTIEKGDTLAVIIGNNKNAVNAASLEINKEHMNNYIYKRLIVNPIYINEDFYIIYNSFANRFIQLPKVLIKKYSFENVPLIKFSNKPKTASVKRTCENITLFNEAKNYKFITDKCIKLQVYEDSNDNIIPYECLTNKSEVFFVSNDKVCSDEKELPQFRLVAVNHFKSRAALHSHVVFYNAEDNKPFRFEMTGEIADKIDYKDSITIRQITFKLPDELKAFYVIEYIYYDFSSGNKINPSTIIPIELYRVKK